MNKLERFIIFILFLFTISNYSYCFAEADLANSFIIKKPSRIIYMPHPEDNPLAEVLMRNDFLITQSRTDGANILVFKIKSVDKKITVYLYDTWGKKYEKYIGKFVYYTENERNEYIQNEAEGLDFINSFIKWLVENSNSSPT